MPLHSPLEGRLIRIVECFLVEVLRFRECSHIPSKLFAVSFHPADVTVKDREKISYESYTGREEIRSTSHIDMISAAACW